MDIILDYPDSANYKNEDGFTPLHILASKPNVFPSSCRLGLFRRLIYRCMSTCFIVYIHIYIQKFNTRFLIISPHKNKKNKLQRFMFYIFQISLKMILR